MVPPWEEGGNSQVFEFKKFCVGVTRQAKKKKKPEKFSKKCLELFCNAQINVCQDTALKTVGRNLNVFYQLIKLRNIVEAEPEADGVKDIGLF